MNMREVLLGQGAASHLDLRARSLHILSVLAGAIIAALIGCAVRGGLEWLKTENIWLTSSIFVFFLPVALPRTEQQTVVSGVMCLTVISMMIGPNLTAKGLMLGLGAYHGHVAHEDFEAWITSPPVSAPASDGAALSSAESKNVLLAANMPFFRLGASMGLGAAGIIEPRALVVTALVTFTTALCVASVLFRKWTTEKAAEDAEREASAVGGGGTDPWARDADGESDVSRAMRRLSDGRARRTGGALSRRSSQSGAEKAAGRSSKLDAVREAEEDMDGSGKDVHAHRQGSGTKEKVS